MSGDLHEKRIVARLLLWRGPPGEPGGVGLLVQGVKECVQRLRFGLMGEIVVGSVV
jgi:hypothetical protein